MKINNVIRIIIFVLSLLCNIILIFASSIDKSKISCCIECGTYIWQDKNYCEVCGTELQHFILLEE